jgi:MFS transporter, FHS family, glucose/mannose:H+ symporter
MNNKTKVKLSLYLNYVVFAILLNSVGIVILKSISLYQIKEYEASALELFKDFSIAIVSFLVGSFLPRIGYKNSMLVGLAVVILACILMYFGNSFGSAKILFAMVGFSFALIKVSVYSMIGLVTNDEKEHAALMSSIEGVFMFGVAAAYFIFPAFNSASSESSWLNVYLLLAGISLLSFVFLLFTKVDSSEVVPSKDISEDIKNMFGLIVKMLVFVFIISAFLFVMVEQGIMTWLPTFNKDVLKLPENISIMMASILAISSGLGRIFVGYFTKKVSWHYVLLFCLAMCMALVVFVLPKVFNVQNTSVSAFSDIPLISFVFPVIGLFLAPIYPILNSTILSALPKKTHSGMSGLIIVFSALGGTLGSRIIGYLFEHFGANQAYYFTLIPMALLAVTIIFLKNLTDVNKNS